VNKVGAILERTKNHRGLSQVNKVGAILERTKNRKGAKSGE
jgi:hypothetical protein